MFIISVFAVFLILVGPIDAKAINNRQATHGYFTVYDPVTATHQRLQRHDIASLGKEKSHLVLFLDNDESLAIRVSFGSVWGSDSIFVVKADTESEEVVRIDGDCFLHGVLVNTEGVVSIDRCGSVTGSIYLPGYRYDLEEDNNTVSRDHHLTFKVTKKNQEPEEAEEDFTSDPFENDYDADVVKQNMIADGLLYRKNKMSRNKREADVVTVEIAVFMDANYSNYLYYELDLDTPQKMAMFIKSKWMTIQGIIGDEETVGAKINLALKKIEVWWSNPAEFPEDHLHIHHHNSWFCRRTTYGSGFDLRVLYVRNARNRQLGTASIGGMCSNHHNCNLVKSPTQRVRVELHQLGHSLGLKHDSRIGDCETPGGFMSFEDSYRFLPCYKRVLTATLRQDNFRCLYQRNVSLPNLLAPTMNATASTTSSALIVEPYTETEQPADSNVEETGTDTAAAATPSQQKPMRNEGDTKSTTTTTDWIPMGGESDLGRGLVGANIDNHSLPVHSVISQLDESDFYE